MADRIPPAFQHPALTLRCVTWSVILSVLLWSAILATAVPHAATRLKADARMALNLPAKLFHRYTVHHDLSLAPGLQRTRQA